MFIEGYFGGTIIKQSNGEFIKVKHNIDFFQEILFEIGRMKENIYEKRRIMGKVRR